MIKKSEETMERQKIAKITRSLIRLKHSLLADAEINNILPDTLMEFDRALQLGELLQLQANLDDSEVDPLFTDRMTKMLGDL
jgi:hypothetical protein